MNRRRVRDEPYLVLIFGASGSGKTTLLRELTSSAEGISVHRKGTDRPPKKYDSDEIVSLREVSEAEYQYIYSQYGNRYGIEKAQIDEALSQGLDHFVICNDIETIRKLRRDYGPAVRALFLLFDAPRDQIEAVQRVRGIVDDQLDLRLAKIGVLSELFLDNSDLFDGVVLNRLGAPPDEMLSQVEGILNRQYTKQTRSHSVVDKSVFIELLDVIEVIRMNLRDLAADRTCAVQKGYVFILMAMTKEDPFLNDIHEAIKRAAKQCSLHAQRVDDIAFTTQITDKVLGSIRCAEFIVADLTHERPNVYYEIGYAHAFKKPTILTARQGTEPHFDVQGFPIISYDNSTNLEHELVRFFRSFETPQ